MVMASIKEEAKDSCLTDVFLRLEGPATIAAEELIPVAWRHCWLGWAAMLMLSPYLSERRKLSDLP